MLSLARPRDGVGELAALGQAALGKIAERTGCDLHRVADPVEILIAARFVSPSAR